jgi:hypothetical protein
MKVLDKYRAVGQEGEREGGMSGVIEVRSYYCRCGVCGLRHGDRDMIFEGVTYETPDEAKKWAMVSRWQEINGVMTCQICAEGKEE